MLDAKPLSYRDGCLCLDKVNLHTIAHEFGTPCYVYSAATIQQHWQAFDNAFAHIAHRICYAVKANSNLSILQLLAKLGSSFDIVSLGELERVLKAGGLPENIVFSGVGKQAHEIQKAIEYGIHCIDVESVPELERINELASSMRCDVNIALRLNPNIDAKTHAHITTGLKENKFGIAIQDAAQLSKRIAAMQHVHLIGIAAHIGSQITELEPFDNALAQLLDVYQTLRADHTELKHLNLGGGLGITYRDEQPPSLSDYANTIIKQLQPYPLSLTLEPGRSIVGPAGVLLTKIEYIKETADRNFAIVDAGMNDLLRPALYDAWQPILPVTQRDTPAKTIDVAGPVCESADFLGKQRELAVITGDLLAIDCAGAYGASMSSNYNSRTRPAEVLVSGGQAHLIRKRERIADLYAHEIMPELVLG